MKQTFFACVVVITRRRRTLCLLWTYTWPHFDNKLKAKTAAKSRSAACIYCACVELKPRPIIIVGAWSVARGVRVCRHMQRVHSIRVCGHKRENRGPIDLVPSAVASREPYGAGRAGGRCREGAVLAPRRTFYWSWSLGT